MRFRANDQRVRGDRRYGSAIVSLLLVIAASGGCGDASDSIAVAAPDFGAGTAVFRVDLATGYVVGSFAAALDGDSVTDAFVIDAGVAQAEVAIAAGQHRLVVRARFASGGRDEAGEREIQFVPPPALPEPVSTDPFEGAASVPVTVWPRLVFATAVPESARASVEVRCNATRFPAVTHAPAPGTVVLTPAGDLPGDTECVLAWRGRDGPRHVDFTTAAAGPPGRVLYDRSTDTDPAPFPDDFWLRPDPNDPGRDHLEITIGGFIAPERLMVDALLHGTRALDGFSPIAHITIALSEAPDPASLPATPEESLDPMASLGLFDLTPGSETFGARIPFQIDLRTTAAWGRVSHGLLLFPSVALASGGRYGVVVTDRVLNAGHRPFRASPFFARARDASPDPDDSEALQRVRDVAGSVLDAVAEVVDPPIQRRDVALALRFTVRTVEDIPSDLRAIKQDVLAGPPPAVLVTSVEPESAEARARDSGVAAIVRGSWQTPDWREHGLTLLRDPETGRPQHAASQSIGFVLALPDAARAGPVPVVFYQHGNPGSAEEVVAHARQSLARAGFAVVGFTDALNREPMPAGASDRDRAFIQIARIMWHLLILKRIPDYFVETNAEQLAFLRAIDELAKIGEFHVPARAGRKGETLHGIDPSQPLTYVGVSEGANLAPAFLAFAPEVRAAALVAGGRRFSEVLFHQEPATLLAPFAGLGISEFDPADVWVMLALFQMIFDRQDGYNFAPYIYRKPFEVAGTTRRASILLTEGLGDAAIPNHATESLARALGPIPQLLPAARRIPSLPAADSPVVANIDVRTTAAFAQFVPQGLPGVLATPGCSSPPLSLRSASEGHYCVQNAPEALLQRLVFLESAVREDAPSIVNPIDP